MGQSRQPKPTGTLAQRLRAVEERLTGSARYRDLRLDLTIFQNDDDRRKLPTGETILTAGGRWDDTFHRFLDPVTESDAETICVVGVEPSQVEFATFGQQWISDYVNGRPRDVQVAMMAGDRRGGKTFIAVAFVISCCVDAPIATDGTPIIAWIVCKSFRERFEIEQWILNRIPSDWYRHLGAPVHEFHFLHGSILRLISADDDDATKQGRVDVGFINEPQKLGARAVANAVLGASDLGGIIVLAANPPSGGGRGEWMFDLKDAIDDEAVTRAKGQPHEPLGVRYFHVDSKKNKSIDQLARRRAGRIATIIDPTLKAGDVEGSWKRPSERACFEFDKHRHLHAAPEVGGAKDVTSIVTARAGIGGWSTVGGVDLQDKPHIVSTFWRCYGDPDDPIFCAVGEMAGERRWTEEEYLDAFSEQFPDWTNRDLLWVMDASGFWQDAAHSKGRTSARIWQDRRWKAIPPQDPRSDRADAKARNPFVDDQLQNLNELLRRDRVWVDPNKCAWLAECFREAVTKRIDGRRKIVQNKHAHALSSALYALWRLAGNKRKGRPLRRGDVSSLTVTRPHNRPL